jgi:hypothetical protein
MPQADEERGAFFSKDRKYRYSLWRIWNPNKGKVLFILLNPSCADEIIDDPTVKRCRSFTHRWSDQEWSQGGFGGFMVGNLFAYRSTDPAELRNCLDPKGYDNDSHLRKMHGESALTVVAWGMEGNLSGRGMEVLRMLQGRVSYLGKLCKNITTTPRHLLYTKYDAELKSLESSLQLKQA